MSLLRTSLLITGIIMLLVGITMYSYASGQSTCKTSNETNWSNIGGIAFITTGIILLIIYAIMPILPGMTKVDDTTDLTVPTLTDTENY